MKRAVIFLFIIICSMNLTACSQDKAAPKSEQQNLAKTITIGVMPDVESIPFVIAEKNDYFEKEGVQVKIEHFSSAKDRDSALQGGKLDGVITDVVAVLFANEGGIQLKIVAKNEGNIELLAGKNSGIEGLKDVEGKKLGISSNTIMEYTADRMLAIAHISPEKINKIAIPPLPTRLEMLQGGKIDLAILPEPLAGLAVKGGARVLISSDEMDNKAGAIAFTAQSLQESPKEIKAVMRAYNDAVAYLETEPLANYSDFIIQEQGFPAEIKDSLTLPCYSKAEKPKEQIVSDVIEWMQTKELIKGNYEYKDLVEDNILR